MNDEEKSEEGDFFPSSLRRRDGGEHRAVGGEKVEALVSFHEKDGKLGIESFLSHSDVQRLRFGMQMDLRR